MLHRVSWETLFLVKNPHSLSEKLAPFVTKVFCLHLIKRGQCSSSIKENHFFSKSSLMSANERSICLANLLES